VTNLHKGENFDHIFSQDVYHIKFVFLLDAGVEQEEEEKEKEAD
jgi:hypothetical protein